MEMLRSIIDHKKVFILALNGPAIGAGAAWFTGAVDIMLAAQGAYLQIPFSALALVPENGSATIMAQSLGVHRANDILMFGRQVTVEEMEAAGLVNRIFPKEVFHDSVLKFLQEQLAVNDGKSMMEMKRLQNAPLRDTRMIAVYNSIEALAERFVEVCAFLIVMIPVLMLGCRMLRSRDLLRVSPSVCEETHDLRLIPRFRQYVLTTSQKRNCSNRSQSQSFDVSVEQSQHNLIPSLTSRMKRSDSICESAAPIPFFEVFTQITPFQSALNIDRWPSVSTLQRSPLFNLFEYQTPRHADQSE